MDRPEATYTDTTAFYRWLDRQVPTGWQCTETIYPNEHREHCSCAVKCEGYNDHEVVLYHVWLRHFYCAKEARPGLPQVGDTGVFSTPQEAIAYWMLTKEPS